MEVFRLRDGAFVKALKGINFIASLLFIIAGLLTFILIGGLSVPKFVRLLGICGGPHV